MRVWLAPSAYAPHVGGVEELTEKIARHLAGRGHEVAVVTAQHPLDLEPVEMHGGVVVYRLPFTASGRHPRRILAHARSRGPTLQRLSGMVAPPDVIHIICASVQTQPLMRFARDRGIPVVLTTQGETAMDAQRIYQRSPWMRRQLRLAARQATVLTACSEWAGWHASTIAGPFATADVIPNGVDAADWASVPDPGDMPVLAAWGRHVPQKGFDLLLKAFQLLRKERPDTALLIGGSGPQTPELRAAAGPGVTFVGSLDRGGVAALLGQARVAVVPSRIEPFGIVAVEALASGRGLVWSVHGGLREASGGLGTPADPFDPEGLAMALSAELASPTPPEAGRQHAQRLDWSRIVDGYERRYVEARRAISAS